MCITALWRGVCNTLHKYVVYRKATLMQRDSIISHRTCHLSQEKGSHVIKNQDHISSLTLDKEAEGTSFLSNVMIILPESLYL